MNTKKIENVVFYALNDELVSSESSRQAIIFYEDGTTEKVSYKKGLDAAEKVAIQENVQTNTEFKNMINRNKIYVIRKIDLEKRYQEFLGTGKPMKQEGSNVLPGINPTNLKGASIPNGDEDELDEEDFEEYSFGYDDEDEDYDDYDDFDDLEEEEEKDSKIKSVLSKLKPKKEKKEKKNIFARAWDKVKKSTAGKFVKRVWKKATLVVTSILLAAGITSSSYALAKSPMEGQMQASNVAAITDVDKTYNENNYQLTASSEYDSLLNETTNAAQEEFMTNVGKTLDEFNGPFADAHMEAGKNIKPGLTWEEVAHITVAYNDYSEAELKAIFNGATIDLIKADNAYKTATLQLMGAHVIETRENPVNMSYLLRTQEGKAFYEKFHNMFLECKETTGQEQINKVNAFFQEVAQEFPITEEIREVGISHADPRNQIESYKLSVVPMIAAAEMMYQNLDIDHTLADKYIDYINDVGLCSYATTKFEEAKLALSNAKIDDSIPTYDEFEAAKIKELKAQNRYVIDDAHRELSELTAFQNAVNWHFEIVDGAFSQKEGYWTTYQTTQTHTESSTTYRTETTTESRPIPQSEKEKIDNQIKKENEAAKQEGEKKAETTRQELQEEADKKAEEAKEEVEKDEKDMQDKIDEANNTINENNKDDDESNDEKVNEKDFGDHNVDFNDEHSDQNGNLNNSVQDITTDGTGDQTGEELPNPEATGSKFDAKTDTTNVTQNTGTQSQTTSQTQPTSQVQTSTPPRNNTIYEYEEPVTYSSNAEKANAIVEEMANNPQNTTDSVKTYTK